MKQAKQPHNILAMTDMNLDHSLCLTMSLDIAVLRKSVNSIARGVIGDSENLKLNRS